MTTPAPGAQIVMGAEELEEILGHPLVDIEIGAKRRVEALNRAGGPVAFVQESLDRVQEGVRLGTEQRLRSLSRKMSPESGCFAFEVALLFSRFARV